MRLIDGDALYKAMQDAEELARRRVRDTESTLPYPNNLNPAYTRYLAQMDERTKAKKMVADAPTVDAVPVVRCRDCEYWDTIPRSTVAPLHHQCKETRLITTGIWYCPLGKRKDGGNHEG